MRTSTECNYCTDNCEFGVGKCHCGCGADTNIATSTYTTALGHRIVKGNPSMYRNGHSAKRLQSSTNSRLSPQEARIIRAMFASQNLLQKDIASLFGVSEAAVSKILMFDSYSDAGIASQKELDDFYLSNTSS